MSSTGHPTTPSVLVTTVVIFLCCGAVLAVMIWQLKPSTPPDFSRYPAGVARKLVFFAYLGPLIDRENEVRKSRRERLLALRERSWGKRDRLWVEELAALYSVEASDDAALLDALLVHVDTIPRSLALAQAAKESGWGTSRFAVEGHNYFGQRCYNKGCGMVPNDRSSNTKFEVRRFDSVEDSVASYMNNINGHPDYEALRAYRAERRRDDEPVSGIQAAERITQYSERRQQYVDEVQSLIHFNELEADR